MQRNIYYIFSHIFTCYAYQIATWRDPNQPHTTRRNVPLGQRWATVSLKIALFVSLLKRLASNSVSFVIRSISFQNILFCSKLTYFSHVGWMPFSRTKMLIYGQKLLQNRLSSLLSSLCKHFIQRRLFVIKQRRSGGK